MTEEIKEMSGSRKGKGKGGMIRNLIPLLLAASVLFLITACSTPSADKSGQSGGSDGSTAMENHEDDYAIEWKDDRLESKVRSFTKIKDRDIMYSDVCEITELDLGECGIGEISGLENFTNLEWLNLNGNTISDISALESLTKLTSLSIGDNQISDISALGNLTNLIQLDIDGNPVTDFSPIEGLELEEPSDY